MKIVHVSSFFLPKLGGMQNVVKELSERLAKKGNKVEIFTSDMECERGKLKSTKNLKINYLPAWEFAHTPIIPSLFSRLMKISKDSVMHVHITQALTPEIVLLVSKIRRIPYVAQVHGDVGKSGKFGFLLSPYKKIFLKRVLKNAKVILVLTEDYKELIHKKYSIDKNKIVIIPNGVGEEFFTKEKSKNKIPHLLFVGRVAIQKNPKRLIEAVSLCKSKFILDIVGDGLLLEETKKLVKQKNLKNVIFHGRKVGRELIQFYRNSNAFILTSNEEAFPLTLLEAMASKLPVIVSDVKGNHDVVNRVGILVNPPTSNNFAKKIDKLITNKRLQKELSKKSLKFAKSHSWDKIVSQTEQVYREVLAEHNKNDPKK